MVSTSLRKSDRKSDRKSAARMLRGNKTIWQSMKANWAVYVCLAPALIYLIIFSYAPMYGIQLAFRQHRVWYGIWGSPWVGLDNFRRFTSSFFFGRTVGNTIRISVYSMVAGFPVPILLALVLNEVRWSKFKKIVQTVTYAPHFISTVVMVGMLFLFFNPVHGIVGQITTFFGMPRTDLINNANTFTHVFVWSGVWQSMGFGSIIYLGVLSSVDEQLHEAAIVEGATKLQRNRHINLPALLPTITILLILNFGSIMSVGFERIFLMQHPLNLSVSEVLATHIFRVGFMGGMDFGLATAIGVFTGVINCAMLILVNQVARKISSTSLW